jgi:hypothetical protein
MADRDPDTKIHRANTAGAAVPTVIHPMASPVLGPVNAGTVSRLEAIPTASGEIIEIARELAERDSG